MNEYNESRRKSTSLYTMELFKDCHDTQADVTAATKHFSIYDIFSTSFQKCMLIFFGFVECY